MHHLLQLGLVPHLKEEEKSDDCDLKRNQLTGSFQVGCVHP
jgi:hypothetical protein